MYELRYGQRKVTRSIHGHEDKCNRPDKTLRSLATFDVAIRVSFDVRKYRNVKR